MQNRFVVVEGCDGSGKTSLASLIADKLSYKMVKTPTKEYIENRHFFDLPERPPMARFFFYCAGILESSNDIRQDLKRGNVVADRYNHSLQVYHEVLVQRPLGHIVESIGLVEQDLTIVLYAEPEICLARMENRGMELNDRLFARNLLFMEAIVERMRTIPDIGKIMKIDTSKLTPEEVLEECRPRL